MNRKSVWHILFAAFVIAWLATPLSALAQEDGAAGEVTDPPAAADVTEAAAGDEPATDDPAPADDTTDTNAGDGAPADEPADEPSTEPAGDADPADTDPADTDPADEVPTDEPAGDTTVPAEDSGDAGDSNAGDEPAESTDDEDGEDEEPAAPSDEPTDGEATSDGEAGDDSAASSETKGVSGLMLAIIIAAVIILPVLIGNRLSAQLQMPDHNWKIATVIGTVLAGVAMVSLGEFKLGPDLGGGVTLIYELEDTAQLMETDENDEPVSEAGNGTQKVDLEKLIGSIKQRVDPSGTKEVVIRPYGPAIEIIVPKASGDELELIKKTISRLGELEFRITADQSRFSTSTEHRIAIESGTELPLQQTLVREGDEILAEWVELDTNKFDEGDVQSMGMVVRSGLNGPEALVLHDIYNVTGDYLTSARKGNGPQGWEVRFNFNARGANRFGKLTGTHLPSPGSGRPYYLGIILDNKLLSAPSINGKITSEGQISGRMSEDEVDEIVRVLDAGSLPAALNKTPVSEAVISSGIGKQTIELAVNAMLVSMALVVVFMMLYYRFAGIVAVLALALNILLVLGVMVLIGAAFTLPGLAGLVLTVGMSVDANVLIFERIREERDRGAALRMAIRNGFARATTTIVDANVTTLIVSIVLYVIGTDQIKGFAVTLFLGIVMSMYTAIFCSRLLFDIAERRRGLRDLKMSRIIGNPGINFLGKATPAIFVSIALIAAGLFGAYSRKSNLLNIDFTGGTSVTMVLADGESIPFDDVREMLEKPLGDKNLQIVERGEQGAGTSYTIDSSESSVEAVQDILAETFGDKLARYSLVVSDVTPSEGVTTAKLKFGNEGDGTTATNYDTVESKLREALDSKGHEGLRAIITNPGYASGSSQRFNEWEVSLALPAADAQVVLDSMSETLNSQPIFPLANAIGPRVASDLQETAVYAIIVSLVGIVGYIWLRFQKISYGLAAVVALVHDVLIALGLVALSAFVANPALKIDAFQISLPVVAAFLTIIGYSLNDTIVVFDRIREVRGKSPRLSADMINTSVNSTLSRTLLTSLTTFIVVTILYWFGGAGIHGFAFTLMVGVVVGTYSSIFVASPALLFLSRYEDASEAPAAAPATST